MTSRMLRIQLGASGIIAIAVIIWIDVYTNVWANYAVISGLAGGLVTFIFTALVVDRFVARSAHERWEPVTRLALGDLRRRFVGPNDCARRLPAVGADAASLDSLIHAAEAERDHLAETLSRWSAFLAASADVGAIMDAIAEIAVRLDSIARQAAEARELIGAPRDETALLFDTLAAEIVAYERAGDAMVQRIEAALRAHAARGTELVAAGLQRKSV